MAQVVYTSLTGTATTITSSGGSQTNLTAISAGDIDVRSGGTANLIQQLQAFFELTSQWSTTTSIAAGTVIADLYLVPKLDGSNAASIDTSSGASYIQSNYRFGSFISFGALSTSTNYRFASVVGNLFPALYTVYTINRSGQTISANWTLKILPAAMQSN